MECVKGVSLGTKILHTIYWLVVGRELGRLYGYAPSLIRIQKRRTYQLPQHTCLFVRPFASGLICECGPATFIP